MPTDITSALIGYEGVKEIEIVGQKDDYFGEVVVCVAVATGDSKKAESDLRALAQENLASFQRPVRYIFIETMPLLDNGKLNKIALKDLVNDRAKSFRA